MKRILCIFLSLIFVFSTVCCFATTMSESEIKSTFNDYIDTYSDGEYYWQDDGNDTGWLYSKNQQLAFIQNNINGSDNYIYYFADDSAGRGLHYYDLNNSTIYSVFYDDEDNLIFLYLSSSCTQYYNSILDDEILSKYYFTYNLTRLIFFDIIFCKY